MRHLKIGDVPSGEQKAVLRIDDEHPAAKTVLPITYKTQTYDGADETKNYEIVVPEGYTVSRLIGSGYYSAAFAATDSGGREYVLKVPNPAKYSEWCGYSGEGPCDGVEYDVLDSEVVSRAILRGFKSDYIGVPDIVLASRKHKYIVEEMAPGEFFYARERGEEELARTAHGLAEFIAACQNVPKDRLWLLALLHWVGPDGEPDADRARLDGPALVHDDINYKTKNLLYDEETGRASIVDFSIAGYADSRNWRFRELERLYPRIRLGTRTREIFESRAGR